MPEIKKCVAVFNYEKKRPPVSNESGGLNLHEKEIAT
jgi:hypothetical protein